MKSIKILSTISLFIASIAAALCQDGNLTVRINTDSLSKNDVLTVSFTLDNLVGNFTPPSFDGFTVVSGPNVSSSYSMINGNVSQKKSYSYNLVANKSGDLTIAPALVETEGDRITTNPIRVYCSEATYITNSDHQGKSYEYGKSTNPSDHQKDSTKKRILKKI